MRGSTQDVAVTFDDLGMRDQQVEWGGMYCSLGRYAAGIDGTELFRGLPGEHCLCPHWGYLISGRMRVRYSDHDEVITAGDMYYLQPGHIPIFEEDTELVEFSPKDELDATLQAVINNVETWQQSLRG